MKESLASNNLLDAAGVEEHNVVTKTSIMHETTSIIK
jgi:hypothetical protein